METPFIEALVILNISVSLKMTLMLIIMCVLLLCSAIISGAETALFSLTPVQIAEIKHIKTAGSKGVIKLIENPKLLLATLLIANNFVNISIVILSSYVTAHLPLEHPVLVLFIQVVLVTLLILLVGEVIPKIIAQRYAFVLSQFIARPVLFIRQLLYPFSMLLVSTTAIIDRKIIKKGIDISAREFSEAIEMSSEHESTTDEERKMLKGIAKFSDIEVKEIMKARTDVVSVDDIIKESGYSRIPVYKETFDNIIGILYVKDLLQYLEMDNTFEWKKLVRPAFFVPENKKIDDLLKEFQTKKTHLSVVVDEYGGTSGIITLEDVIEEIVGEINDEFDVNEPVYEKIDEKTYIFEAKTSLNDFCKILEIDDAIFDEVRGEADSLGGLILELNGKIPARNHSTRIKNFNFVIDTVDKRRIKKIKVIIDA